ncbi:armadillo-like helical domain-containing protein [Heterostelium album PN500]|uniref:Armadillo-like helical domain-containing protein n=1 Tax=Heterostelium pallidum (strain ATCC 26659 / Pp 5 / PN500) TaxID=670386 RepID=D3BIH4_HETP5|nr:armadillo-like helical domain-containing protein [Heterostelium album PN500]EFA78598.1 armadillo-like helical domain-containing protein [Heterostelium album PN500]|eukprot:XP_020430722.1 armadillo-like helical domain-containing protein [Heterostelium album PN500]
MSTSTTPSTQQQSSNGSVSVNGSAVVQESPIATSTSASVTSTNTTATASTSSSTPIVTPLTPSKASSSSQQNASVSAGGSSTPILSPLGGLSAVASLSSSVSGQTPPSTPEPIANLLNRGLNKVLADCGKKQQPIKEEIRNILETLKQHPNLLTKTTEPEVLTRNPLWITIVQQLSNIYRQSFESRLPKLINPAVELVERRDDTFADCKVGGDSIDQVPQVYTGVGSKDTLLYIYNQKYIVQHNNTITTTNTTTTTSTNNNNNNNNNTPKLQPNINNNDHSVSSALSSSAATTPDISGVSTANLSLSLPPELQSPLPNILTPSSTVEQVANIIDEMIDKAVNTNQQVTCEQKESTITSGTNQQQQSTSDESTSSQIIHPTVLPASFDNEKEEYDISLRDAILIFRLLCELSLREISDYESPPEVKIRIFSLELLSSIFEDFGRCLKNFPNIVNYEIREGLFPSILASGLSPNNTIFRISLTLFLYIVVHYREFLKDEIGQYFSIIILRVLESTTSSIQHRWLVLQVLRNICENTQILIDLYVNYDCSVGSKDIFQRTIEDLSKIAQMVVPENKMYELKVKYLALECLALMLKSLDEGLRSKKEGLAAKLASLPAENQYTLSKQKKLKIEEAKLKFKSSPKKGVDQFVNLGVVERNDVQLAKFFRDTEGLDKTSIGVYISEKENAGILDSYTELFNFTGYTLDNALRYFTAYFRLPGEAQKVDRVVQAFAKRFYIDNQSTPSFEFANDDAAFILSFAIVMLATDLHSTAIKTHMTKPDWIKMNAGINDKKNFDEQYLLGIYDRISLQRLSLKDDDDISDEPSLNVRTTFNLDDPHKPIVDTRDRFHHGNLLVQLKTMLSYIWHPILVSLSLVLENVEDRNVLVCLEGFRCAINLTSLLTMSIEKEAFVSSLANFTIFDKIKELKPKNIESLEKMIQIARIDGNYLQKSWHPVLKSISQLERLRINYLGVNNPNPDSEKLKRTMSTSDFFQLKSSQRSTPIIPEGITIDMITKDLDTANHLYVNSSGLNDSAIVFFVEALTQISLEEIRSTPNPSTFSLLKLVEVAIYNQSRIKLIWQLIADHFTKIGSQPENVYISSLVIDSLKQLAQKFLELEEINKDSSQKDFLRPLELIFHANSHPEVRELILKCIFQLTNGRNAMIKSGWKPIFTIFTLSSFAEPQIASQAFDFVDELSRDFTNITETFFIDYVNCLSTYANSKHKDLSLKAIDILSYCGVQLANGRVCQLSREEGANGSNSTLFTDSEQHISLWFPLLTGLARVISHEDSELRSYALDTLFRVLALFGSTFSPKLWELIFRGVLLPIFDNVGYSKGAPETILEDTKWLIHTGDRAFKSLTEMFINFIDIICFLLDDMLDLFVCCILQDNEILAKTAGTFLIQLVTLNGNKFSDVQWSNVCHQFHKIFQTNTPVEIFNQSSLLMGMGMGGQPTVITTTSPMPTINEQQPPSTPTKQNPHLNGKVHSSLAVKNVDKHPSSAPISPVLNGTNNNNFDKSNHHHNVPEHIQLRQSASLPTTPLSLTPPISRVQSTENMQNSPSEAVDQQRQSLSNNNDSSDNNNINGSDSDEQQQQQSSPTSNNNNNNQQPNSPLPSTSSPHHNRSYSSPTIPTLISMKKQHARTTSLGGGPQQDALKQIQSKCSVQLQMVQAINDIAFSHYEFLNSSQLLCLGDCLEISYQFCLSVFKDDKLHPLISRIGTVLKILQQNTITGYLNLLIVLYTEQCIDATTRTLHSEHRLVSLFRELTELYIKNQNETIVQTDTMLKILKSLLQFNDEKFMRNMSIFYDLLIKLLLNDSKDVRIALREILIRLGSLRGTIDKQMQQQRQQQQQSNHQLPLNNIVQTTN